MECNTSSNDSLNPDAEDYTFERSSSSDGSAVGTSPSTNPTEPHPPSDVESSCSCHSTLNVCGKILTTQPSNNELRHESPQRAHDEPSALILDDTGITLELFSKVMTECRCLMQTRGTRSSIPEINVSVMPSEPAVPACRTAFTLLKAMRGRSCTDEVRQREMEAAFIPMIMARLLPATQSAVTFVDGRFVVQAGNGEQALIGVLSTQMADGSRFHLCKQIYKQFWEQHPTTLARISDLPCLFVELIGIQLFVFGAILMEGCVIGQPLAAPVNIYDQRTLTDFTVSSTATCLDRIHSYYSDLGTTKRASPSPTFPRIFDWPATYSGPGGQFTYVRRLGSAGPSCCTFLARRSDGTPLVVKFVRSYSAEAHRLLAEKHLAPELHFCGPCDVYGMQMVVMDFIPGIPLSDIATGTVHIVNRDFSHAMADLRCAMATLHEHDFVFGDLRMPNILLCTDKSLPVGAIDQLVWMPPDDNGTIHRPDSSGATSSHCSSVGSSQWRAVIIDFDWSGREGVVRYPKNINLSGELDWHRDVRRGGLILAEHDEYCLEQLENDLAHDLELLNTCT